MDGRDYDAFCLALETLSQRLPKTLTQPLIDAYFKTLRAYSIEVVLRMLDEWPLNREHKRFPLEYDLIEHLKRVAPKRKTDFAEEGNIRRKLAELKEKRNKVVMQILGKGLCIDILRRVPRIKDILASEGTLANFLTIDYGAHVTPMGKEELEAIDKELYKEILWYEFLLKNPAAGNLKKD